MSSRWKKPKKSKPKKNQGWMTWEVFCREYEKGRVGPNIQKSGCKQTGEVYVRPVTGRFRNQPEEKLQRMVEELCQIFAATGQPPAMDTDEPLWMQAEFLDNMLDFELNPPCGCPSELKKVIKTV
jgi:hypothetical protein